MTETAQFWKFAIGIRESRYDDTDDILLDDPANAIAQPDLDSLSAIAEQI